MSTYEIWHTIKNIMSAGNCKSFLNYIVQLTVDYFGDKWYIILSTYRIWHIIENIMSVVIVNYFEIISYDVQLTFWW